MCVCVPQELNNQLQVQLVRRERDTERLKLALDAAADRTRGAPSGCATPPPLLLLAAATTVDCYL